MEADNTAKNYDASIKPFFVDRLPEVRWVATCAICEVSRELTHESIADGTWITCPTCEAIRCAEFIELKAA